MGNELDGFELAHSDLSFLKELEKYSFESKMLLCQRYACGLMDCSQLSMEKAMAENIMPWELEVFSLFSILYDSDSVTSIPGNVFESVITKIRNYFHPFLLESINKGAYVDDFIMISSLQQFSVHGLILQKLFRYSYIFNYKGPEFDCKERFIQRFGVDYSVFEEYAFLMYESLCNYSGLDSDTRHKLLMVAFENASIVNELKIDKSAFRQKMNQLNGGKIEDCFYGLKLQSIYPIIGDDSFNYLPLPYLVINAVSESLLNKFTEGDNALRSMFGKHVLEDYLYDIYYGVSSVTWISKEIKYRIGRKEYLTSDVIVCEDEYCVLYDIKSLAPSIKVRRFDQKEIDKNVRMYAEAIREIYNQIRNYNDGDYELDREYEKDKIFGVAVVFEDAYIPRKRVYDYLFQTTSFLEEEKDYIHGHVKIVSLRQIEDMVIRDTSFLRSLVLQVEDRDKWDYTELSISCSGNDCIPIYMDYEVGLKNRVRRIIDEHY